MWNCLKYNYRYIDRFESGKKGLKLSVIEVAILISYGMAPALCEGIGKIFDTLKEKKKLDKIPRVFNCHCIDCRKKIGGIITIIQLRDKALEIDENKLSKYSHPGGSKNTITKSSCIKDILKYFCLIDS